MDGPKDGQRIAKWLARAGIASRREIERMIVEGRIALNGVTIDTPATILNSLHGVTVDGNPVAAPAPARLFLYHKPNGVLVTERDPNGRPTIYDRLPRDLPRLMPVGRLDLNTEGLLLLTTDGELKRQLELPSTGVERAYRARAYGQVSQAQLEDLIEGVTIEGVRYGSIDANLERRTGANVWIEIIITEGKNREVRRVLEYLGLRVSRLIRTRYGPFVLADLPAGEIGEVRQADLVGFRRDPKRKPPPEPMRFKDTADARASTARARSASPKAESHKPERTSPDRGKAARDVIGHGKPAPRQDRTAVPSDKPVRGKPSRDDGPRARTVAPSRQRRTMGDPRRRPREDDDISTSPPAQARLGRADRGPGSAARNSPPRGDGRARVTERSDDRPRADRNARPERGARPERNDRTNARPDNGNSRQDRPTNDRSRPDGYRKSGGNPDNPRPAGGKPNGRPAGGKPRKPRTPRTRL